MTATRMNTHAKLHIMWTQLKHWSSTRQTAWRQTYTHCACQQQTTVKQCH